MIQVNRDQEFAADFIVGVLVSKNLSVTVLLKDGQIVSVDQQRGETAWNTKTRISQAINEASNGA